MTTPPDQPRASLSEQIVHYVMNHSGEAAHVLEAEVTRMITPLRAERDAALAKVAEVEKDERDIGWYLASIDRAYTALGVDRADPDAVDPAYIGEAVERLAKERNNLAAELARARGLLGDVRYLFHIQAQSERMLGIPVAPAIVAACEAMGYGAMIQACVIAWTKKDPHGAFTIGNCLGVVKGAIASIDAFLSPPAARSEGDGL